MVTTENLDLNLKRDLIYIENELMSKHTNGHYCKFSRLINAVTIIDITKEQYIKYWAAKYANNDIACDAIIKCCIEKLTNGLLPPNEMMQLIADSDDRDDEKEKTIKLLGGKYQREGV